MSVEYELLSESVDPPWRIIPTDDRGVAAQHILARWHFLACMSKHMGEVMTAWITEAGVVASLEKHMATSVYQCAEDIALYRKEGVLRPALVELVTHVVTGMQDKLLQDVRVFCERCKLTSPWEGVILDHLCFHALQVVTGVPRTFRGEELQFCPWRTERLLGPFQVRPRKHETPNDYRTRATQKFKQAFEERSPVPSMTRGRVPRDSTAGKLETWAWWFYEVTVNRKTEYRLAKDLFGPDEDHHRDVQLGVDRIRDLFGVIGYPRTDQEQNGLSGVFLIQSEINLADSSANTFVYSSLS